MSHGILLYLASRLITNSYAFTRPLFIAHNVSEPTASWPARAGIRWRRDAGPRTCPPLPRPPSASWNKKRSGWRNPRQALDWMASLRRYAFPRIGRMPVSEVTSGDVLEILAPIWHAKAPTAKVLRQRIRTVLEWAVAMEYRPDNPADRVGPVLGPQDAAVRHMRALPHCEVASALAKVRASDAMPVAKLAFELLVLTAARWGEIRWAEWPEIDRTAGVWTVPATRMKAKREHRVPLGRCAMQILDEARRLDDGASRMVFTRGRGKPLADKQLRQLRQRLEIAAVPHGFRSSFRDWAAEETNHPREVVEAALAHVVQNKVEAAYRRTDLFERRRQLMDDWAAYLAGESRTGG